MIDFGIAKCGEQKRKNPFEWEPRADGDLNQLALTCLEVAYGERPTSGPWYDVKVETVESGESDEDHDLCVAWCTTHRKDVNRLKRAIPGLTAAFDRISGVKRGRKRQRSESRASTSSSKPRANKRRRGK